MVGIKDRHNESNYENLRKYHKVILLLQERILPILIVVIHIKEMYVIIIKKDIHSIFSTLIKANMKKGIFKTSKLIHKNALENSINLTYISNNNTS